MIYATISMVILLLGFHYVIMMLANKESGNVKLIGQVLGVLVLIIALVVLLYAVTGREGCPMMGGKEMSCGCGMMGSDLKAGKCETMMKDKGMKPMMHKKTAK
jgi:hypothetical protein